MNKEHRPAQDQDDQLIAFTDALLAGREVEALPRPALAETVEALAYHLAPEPVPEHLRRAVKQDIRARWPRPADSWRAQLQRLLANPAPRWALATVAALALFAVVATWWAPEGMGALTGAALGELDPLGIVIGLVLLGLALVGWLLLRK